MQFVRESQKGTSCSTWSPSVAKGRHLLQQDLHQPLCNHITPCHTPQSAKCSCIFFVNLPRLTNLCLSMSTALPPCGLQHHSGVCSQVFMPTLIDGLGAMPNMFKVETGTTAATLGLGAMTRTWCHAHPAHTKSVSGGSCSDSRSKDGRSFSDHCSGHQSKQVSPRNCVWCNRLHQCHPLLAPSAQQSHRTMLGSTSKDHRTKMLGAGVLCMTKPKMARNINSKCCLSSEVVSCLATPGACVDVCCGWF